MPDKNNLIWIDLEMTGLNPQQDVIIEMATIVTDVQLNIIAEGPVLAIHQPDHMLAGMDEWNTNTHTKSGLVERVKQSQVDTVQGEQLTLAFLRQYVVEGKSPMCGNSICQDRRFLANYMPELEAFFHYRHVDVSTIKELVCRWRQDIYRGFNKKAAHEALADIKESIEELRYYRQTFFKMQED